MLAESVRDSQTGSAIGTSDQDTDIGAAPGQGTMASEAGSKNEDRIMRDNPRWEKRGGVGCALIAMALMIAAPALLAGPARAGGFADEAPAAAERMFSLSANVAIGTEYVFRGFSQTAEHATVQGGFDASIGIFYAGVWASNLDFGAATNGAGATVDIADIEMDWYAGIKPTYNGVTFDLGVIYYTYPDAFDPGAELDYVEIKAGVSAPIAGPVSGSLTVFHSPEYTGKTGRVWTVEGGLEVALPKMAMISPTLSATLGSSMGDSAAFRTVFGNGDSSYLYWNVGLGLGFMEKFNLDLRYWDTDISNAGNFCTGATFQCDGRFVATLSASF